MREKSWKKKKMSSMTQVLRRCSFDLKTIEALAEREV
jgi:hypothetical protein